MSHRTYDGPAISGSDQFLSEAPHWQRDGETVDVVDDRVDGAGEERTENVPTPASAVNPPETEGQSPWDDWDWRDSR